MAGTWMSVVKGFGGMRVRNGQLHFNPILPKNWDGYSFKIGFKGRLLEIKVTKKGTIIQNTGAEALTIFLNGEEKTLAPA
ncbi:MAG: glycosyl hydrolase family 65 protein, partial [Cyclobacteriaceae bacterium]